MTNENKAETLLNKHQSTTKYKYTWTTRDGRTFGTNDALQIDVIRNAVIEYNEKLAIDAKKNENSGTL